MASTVNLGRTLGRESLTESLKHLGGHIKKLFAVGLWKDLGCAGVLDDGLLKCDLDYVVSLLLQLHPSIFHNNQHG